MERSQFGVPSGYDFKVVIDFPFDDPSRTPQEDERRVVALKDEGLVATTLVWLPSFFSDRLQRELGELVVIDRRDLLELLRTSPNVALKLLAMLGGRVRQLSADLEDSLYLGLSERLARRILGLAERFGRPVPGGKGTLIDLKLSQQALGEMVVNLHQQMQPKVVMQMLLEEH